MNMTENANLIELLWEIGLRGDEVSIFQLGVEGRISIEEASRRIRDSREKRESEQNAEENGR